jgi:hypothetical protein
MDQYAEPNDEAEPFNTVAGLRASDMRIPLSESADRHQNP